MSTNAERPSAALRRRLFPLYVAAGLQGFMLWTPVEKLFLNEIGFDAAAVGLMAAAYAALVPLVEVPSGLLADRWSRRGVLVIANLALFASVLVGGLSHSVPTYIAGAMILGIYFAMYSGTMDALVYDTVREETGDSGQFERMLGRARAVESAALVISSLAGGVLAGLLSTRTTYFLSLPFALLSILALARFAEPTLHRPSTGSGSMAATGSGSMAATGSGSMAATGSGSMAATGSGSMNATGPGAMNATGSGRTSVRSQISITYRTIAGRGRLLPVVALAVLTALISQTLFEFGPLWLVAFAAAPALYGPFWAALVATLGLGGLLAGRLPMDRPLVRAALTGAMTLASVALTVAGNLMMVAVAQVTLVLLAIALSIHVTRLLHDAVPSAVRAGVASGVGAFSWMAFLPFALAFGVAIRDWGVDRAGWLVTSTVLLVGLALVADGLTRARRLSRPYQPRPVPAAA